MNTLIMYAEALEDGKWKRLKDKRFESAIESGMMTDRVCDERNYYLNLMLGADESLPTVHHTHVPVVDSIVVNENCRIVSLEDLKNYDWDIPIYQVGIIDEWQYKRWIQQRIEPADKYRYVVNENSKIVSPYEMDKILRGAREENEPRYYIRFNYDGKKMKELCSFFYEKSLPALFALGKQYGDDKLIRVAYEFVKYSK